MLRALLPVLLFAAGFLAVRAAVERLAPERMKLAWALQQEQPVDTVFIGSSRVYRQLDPARFDARMAAAGRPGRSLNLGMQGMRFPETAYLAERLLREPPPGLRRLFLELSSFETALEEENRLTERTVYWHSWPVTAQLLRAVAASGLPPAEKLRRAEMHLVHWAHRFGNLGRGPAAWSVLAEGAEQDFEERRTLGPAGDGFRSLDSERGPNFAERRRLFLADLEKFRGFKQALGQDDAAPPEAAILPALRRLDALAREAGVELVLMVLPVVEREPGLARLGETGLAPRLLRFDDPAAWPDFYLARNRFDMHHLDGRGAALLSEALADELLRLEARED